MYADLNAVYLSRPARRQKDFIDPKKYHMEGAQEYNIWYGKYIGDIADKMDKEPAADRCVLETDAGYTKADLSTTNIKHRRYFCLHFARGMCAKGSECIFYHRVPLPEDNARCDELFDTFGRQRHSKHKDDMSGVGTFAKPCRTLFVGNLIKTQYESPKALEDALWRHFGEWGELESLNVIHRLSIAFPRFRLRNSAEFAKEAMMCQALDQGEVLSIRWAHDDPNPVAQDSIARADRDALVGLMKAKGISLTPAGFDYPADYHLPEPKRMRLEDGGALLEAHPELAYPDTSQQYAQAEEAKKDALRRLGLLDDTPKEAPAAVEAVPEAKADEAQPAANEDDEEGGWQECKDESSGAVYYFNTSTGESSWTRPQDMPPAAP